MRAAWPARGVPVRARTLATLGLGALIAVAASLPPGAALPMLIRVADHALRAWFYFWSMMLGAAPYLTIGALAAAVANRVTKPNAALPLFALLFPGCDCSMNAYAPTLRGARPGLAAFALVWGSCCNPLALLSTATILGRHMLWNRLLVGAIAAGLSAFAWSRLGIPSRSAQACATHSGFWEFFAQLVGSGVVSFAFAAGTSAVYLAFLDGAALSHGAVSAALIGAVLSPCSSADALLARVLFADHASQLTFIVAAQCMDVRQLGLIFRSFGATHAACALGAAAVACFFGCLVANR